MAMLTNWNSGRSGILRRTRASVGLAAIAALACSATFLARPSSVRAMDPAAPNAASQPIDRPVEFFPQPSEAEQKILIALGKPTSFDFVENTLQDAVDFLKELHQIEIVLDKKTLADSGQGSDTQVTFKANNLSLRSALRLLLMEADGLTFCIQDEVLMITTREIADAALFTRTYPVGDLIDKDYECLTNAIRSSVYPGSWSKVGGPGSLEAVPAAKSLVISQTQEAHDEVLQLLRSLRAAQAVAVNSPPKEK
jgi:hypothetical protein